MTEIHVVDHPIIVGFFQLLLQVLERISASIFLSEKRRCSLKDICSDCRLQMFVLSFQSPVDHYISELVSISVLQRRCIIEAWFLKKIKNKQNTIPAVQKECSFFTITFVALLTFSAISNVNKNTVYLFETTCVNKSFCTFISACGCCKQVQ